MADSIPIENIYYLLCYAWNRLEEGEMVDVDASKCETLQDLFAQVLANGTQRLIRRGFHREYVTSIEESASLRGRIAMTPSVRDLSWVRGRMHCEFSELSYDVLPNRILKSTLRNLYYCEGLSKESKEGLSDVLGALEPVSSVRLTGRLFRRVQCHQNMRFYRFLLNVCELVFDSLIPTEQAGGSRFRDFLRDPKRMPRLFEDFVRNFYAQHAIGWKVHPGNRKLAWYDVQGATEALSFVPQMETDVELTYGSTRLIVDCKFYLNALAENWSVERFRSAHLYQMYAYLQNSQKHEPLKNFRGMLLYPQTHDSMRHEIVLQGFPLSFVTINLNQPWKAIESDLLGLLKAVMEPHAVRAERQLKADGETVGSLFKVQPEPWGARGDPYLWQELESILQKVPLPRSVERLRLMLEASFLAVTGYAVDTDDFIYVERFAHGGMSSGQVAAHYWREEAIPLLLQRFAWASQKKQTVEE